MFKFQLPSKTGKITLFTIMIMTGIAQSVSSEVFGPNAVARTNNMTTAQTNNLQDNSGARELALVREVHQQINEYRKSLNLAPLTLNAQISEQARQHSKNMAEKKVEFSHNGFDRRIKALKSISYRSAAENVGYNQGYRNPVKQAVAGWIESEGHRQNLTGNFNLTGIGVVKNQQDEYYFTQIFILEN